MNNGCPDKVEPMDQLFFSVNNVSLTNLKNSIFNADICIDRAKDQVKGAVTAYGHLRNPDISERVKRTTIEHLKFVQQEITAIPKKQLLNDIRILIAQMEKEMRDGNDK